MANIDEIGSSTLPMFYLGKLSGVNLQSGERDRDVQLIDHIEEAQLDNRLPIFPKQSDLIHFSVSTHGFKVTETSTGNVTHRYPLHSIAQVDIYF